MGNITQESFEALLGWLDPDREIAGQKYELIQTGLIRIFVSKGFTDAEHLADKTINVVILRLPDIRDNYVGDKVRYFHGVARNLMLEERRRKEIATDELPVFISDASHPSDEYECLLRCLNFLPADKRELILDYHSYKGHDKLEIHREMAHELAITENALRVRAHQIRRNLENCVQQCVRSLKPEMNQSANA